MDFSRWLTGWLTRHPLKEPTDPDRTAYTREVISKLKVQAAPARATTPRWWILTNPAMAFAAAAAVVLVVMMVRKPSESLLTQRALHDAALLAAVGENGVELPGDETERLADDLELLDALVLAEAPPSDDAWIQQTMQLLDQLDEDPSSDDASTDGGDDEEWLNDLEMLDQDDLASTTS